MNKKYVIRRFSVVMRLISILAIVLVLLAGNKCKKSEKSDTSDKTVKTARVQTPNPPKGEDNKALYKKWIHSHEDDQGDVKAYRPDTYEFPPARGRSGFTVKENGEFIQHNIHPADRGTVPVNGKWEANPVNKTLKISLEDKTSYQIEIVSLEDDMLKVKILR